MNDEKVYTQKQLTEIQVSILEKLEQIYKLGWNAFITNYTGNKEATTGHLNHLLNKVLDLTDDLKTDIKIETSTVEK